MMRSAHQLSIVSLLIGCLLVAFPLSLLAQNKGLDCREQTCSTADLQNALFPIPMRGITPVKPPAPVQFKVEFMIDSDVILPAFYEELNKLGTVLSNSQNEDRRLEIKGHTDDVGPEQYNMSLSFRRAESVKQYLEKHFEIDGGRLVVKGAGEAEPYETNATSEGRQKNRRVEVKGIQ